MKANSLIQNSILSLFFVFTSFMLLSPIAYGEETDVVKLRVMETADVHCHLTNYDYTADKTDDTSGFVKTATLIKEARQEVKNALLFENGDLIQGSPMADFAAKKGASDTHPVYKAMNLLHYDAGNLGNHDFNYGLDFLEKTIQKANFPYVCANVYTVPKEGNTEEKNHFPPYILLDRELIAEDGQKHQLKIGVIGFVPPEIMQWDKANLQGKVITKDIYETAEKYVPQMKAEGADLIIAVAHSGLGNAEYEHLVGNQSYQLSKIKEINAILFGHTHTTFPGRDYEGKAGLDNVKGTVNGTPAVQPGFWGNHLGMIDLTLKRVDGKWEVTDSQSHVRAIYDSKNRKPLVEADQEVIAAVQDDHQGTIDYMNQAIGRTEIPLMSYFAQVQDEATVQIINDAQKSYMQKYIQGTEWDGMPVLSAAAPFRAGVDGVSDFTDIPAGDLRMKDAASLYKYPNTLVGVKLTGAEIIEWLEWSAGQFNQIDTNETDEQFLVKDNSKAGGVRFESYDFDIIDGITYQIDVTQPQRYDEEGKKQISDGRRIVNVKYQSKPIDLAQEFIVVTNSYRAGFSKFANPDGKRAIIESPDEARQVLMNHIAEQGIVNPQADGNWSFVSIKAKGNLVFRSSPEARRHTTDKIEYLEILEDGFAKFKLNLS